MDLAIGEETLEKQLVITGGYFQPGAGDFPLVLLRVVLFFLKGSVHLNCPNPIPIVQ